MFFLPSTIPIDSSIIRFRSVGYSQLEIPVSEIVNKELKITLNEYDIGGNCDAFFP